MGIAFAGQHFGKIGGKAKAPKSAAPPTKDDSFSTCPFNQDSKLEALGSIWAEVLPPNSPNAAE
jgi:hypothetical protein